MTLKELMDVVNVTSDEDQVEFLKKIADPSECTVKEMDEMYEQFFGHNPFKVYDKQELREAIYSVNLKNDVSKEDREFIENNVDELVNIGYSYHTMRQKIYLDDAAKHAIRVLMEDRGRNIPAWLQVDDELDDSDDEEYEETSLEDYESEDEEE